MFKIQNKISAFLNYIGYHNWGRIVKDGFLNLILKPSQSFTSSKNLKTLLNQNRSNLLPNSYPGVYMLTYSFDTVSLREICPNTEFSLVCIFRKNSEYGHFHAACILWRMGKESIVTHHWKPTKLIWKKITKLRHNRTMVEISRIFQLDSSFHNQNRTKKNKGSS